MADHCRGDILVSLHYRSNPRSAGQSLVLYDLRRVCGVLGGTVYACNPVADRAFLRFEENGGGYKKLRHRKKEKKMTDKEQIKEMAQIICGRCEGGICLIDNSLCHGLCEELKAEELYNAGYRKIDDKHVVIMKEELHRLKSQVAEYKKRIDKFIKDRELKAVKEFAEMVKEKALSHCRTINCYELRFIETTIDELLTEYEK